MNEADGQLDDALRRVPLPGELRAALTPEALFADAALDRLLAAVAVPPGLAERVRAAAHAPDAPARNGMVDLDRAAAGRDEPAAADQWPTIDRRRRSRGFLSARELGRLAAALGLAVCVSLAGIRLSLTLEAPGMQSSQAVAVAARRPDAREPRLGQPVTQGQGSDGQTGREVGHGDATVPDVPDPIPERARTPEAISVSETAVVESRMPPTPEPEPERFQGILRTGPTDGPPPSMKVVDLIRDWRRTVPKSAKFDLTFELANGESPFIDPAADASLAVDRPPLSLGTEAFDRLAAGLSLLAPRDAAVRLRAEELLAAMPPPPQLTAAGPEPVRLGIFAVGSGRLKDAKPSVLLEVAAFAAGSPRDQAAPRRVTLILDQAAAGDPLVWPRICRGLAAVAGGLGPDDRVSVVLAGKQPRLAIGDADAAALAANALDCEGVPAAEYSDLDAAVEFARRGNLLGGQTVVVAHSVTVDRCRGELRDLLAAWHAALSLSGGDPLAGDPDAKIRFVLLDRATPAPARDAGPTFGRTSPDAVAIRREMLRQVTGEDTLVARQCSLEVRFDPRHVAAYRLIGYRQSVVETLAAGPPATIDLHAGETVRAVYEVVPRATGTAGLATARLTWRTPQGTAARLDATDSVRAEPALPLPSPHGCELVLAATLGDFAGESAHFSRRQRDAQRVLESLAEEWRARGDVTPFGAALVEAINQQGDGLRGGR